MLNHYKIGTKLLAGFLGLTFLTLVIGWMGWHYLGEVAHEMATMQKLNSLSKEGSIIVEAAVTAKLNSLQYVQFRQDKFLEEVDKEIKIITEGYAHLIPLIGDDNPDVDISNKMLEEYKTEADVFLQKQKDYVAAYKAKLKADAVRFEAAGIVDKNVNQVLGLLDDANAANTYKDADGKEILDPNKQPLIPLNRVSITRMGEAVITDCLNIRVATRDYELNLGDEKKRNDLQAKMDGIFAEIDGVLKQLKNFLPSNDAKAAIDEAMTNLADWKTAVAENAACNINMLNLQTEQEKIAEIMVSHIRSVDEILLTSVEACSAKAAAMTETASRIIIGASLVAIIAGIVFGMVLRTNITSGVRMVTGIMEKLAKEGDLSVTIPDHLVKRGDEIGTLGQAARLVFGDYEAVTQLAERLARGDWTVKVRPKGEKDAMNQNLGSMLDMINVALKEINDSVRQVSTGASEVSTAAQNLSSGAQESAASLEQITASMSEISGQTKKNAQSAADARDLAQKASSAAHEGQDAMKKMNDSMERIMKNSAEVQRVIKVIDDIAFQTNLLALNAAVEAARAGQHGKGFAVVAEEVRNLAARSAKAAKETSELIATSGTEIQRGGEVSTQTANVLNTIVGQIKKTTDLVAGIAIASNEQAEGVGQVTVGLQQIDAVTQQNTASAEESASAANEMSSMSSTLQSLIAKFKTR